MPRLRADRVRLEGWSQSASRRANPAIAKLDAPTVAPAGASPFRENFVRGGPMRELALHVEDHQIIVNLIDAGLTMTYQLSPDGQLEENKFWTVDGGDPEFRQRARQAAFSTARQLAWIPPNSWHISRISLCGRIDRSGWSRDQSSTPHDDVGEYPNKEDGGKRHPQPLGSVQWERERR